MATQIFVNLPVKDLNKSMSFFKSLGFGFNAEFTDETAACMVVSENIYVMLLTHEKFKEFTPKEICDATRCTEVLVGLSCEGRPNVDELVRKAVVAGGSTAQGPARLRIHVWTRIPGFGRSQLGTLSHGVDAGATDRVGLRGNRAGNRRIERAQEKLQLTPNAGRSIA